MISIGCEWCKWEIYKAVWLNSSTVATHDASHQKWGRQSPYGSLVGNNTKLTAALLCYQNNELNLNRLIRMFDELSRALSESSYTSGIVPIFQEYMYIFDDSYHVSVHLNLSSSECSLSEIDISHILRLLCRF